MPLFLPPNIAYHYHPATGNDVRAKSYGLLKAARINADPEWRNQRGTFDDQAIFGPKRDFECACGKYFGRDHAGVICDQCGVKITTTDARRTRCAHINLPVPVSHPLAEAEPLNSLPVLPVAFIEAPDGAELLRAYDAILRASDASGLSPAFEKLLEVLAPLLVIAHNWNLSDRRLIAHGMALKEATA